MRSQASKGSFVTLVDPLTNEPWTIGTNISSGCIRLTNEDIVDLYNRTPIGAKVIVFGTGNGILPRRLGLGSAPLLD